MLVSTAIGSMALTGSWRDKTWTLPGSWAPAPAWPRASGSGEQEPHQDARTDWDANAEYAFLAEGMHPFQKETWVHHLYMHWIYIQAAILNCCNPSYKLNEVDILKDVGVSGLLSS